jgi:hypothetical protein
VRVYFHLVNSHERIRDAEGVEVSVPQEARFQAIRAIEDLRAEDQAAARDWSGWTLVVADASETALFSLDLGAHPG